MTTPLRALMVASPPDALRMTEELVEAGFHPGFRRVETQADYRAQLGPCLDVILAEARLPGFDALLALMEAQGRGLDVPFIVLTGAGDEGAAAECVRQGAADSLLHDRPARLGQVVKQALEHKRLRQGLARAEAALRESEGRAHLQSHAAGGRLARLAMLREIDRGINGGRPIQDVLNVVLECVPEQLGAAAVAVSLLNEDRSGARVFAMRLPNGTVIEEEAFNLAEGLFQQMVKDKTPAVVPDVTQDPRVQMHLAVIRNSRLTSYLGVPLVTLDRTIGILHLLTTEPREFAAEDVDFFCSLAGQAAIGIENARLFQRAQQREEATTRLRQAEEARDASETRLQDILDNAPAVVHVKDPEGRYLLVNRLWEERFHRHREEVIGRRPHEVFPREQADAILANHRRVLDAGAPMTFEEVAQHDDGPRTYLSSKFPLLNGAAAPYGVCAISTDITERKRAEEALGDSAALYHSLVESLPVCIIRKDLLGRFTFANQAFCAGLGRPLEQVIGRTDLDFYPEELARKYQGDDRRVIETGELFEDEEEHLTAGNKRHVEVLKGRLRDARGLVIGVQVLFWDVTRRKQAEEDRARSAAEFRVASRIQQRLFPSRTPRLPGLDVGGGTYGFDVGGASYPAEAIGGDYFDYVGLPDGSLGIAIGDVSGHGVGPALLMAEARAFVRACAQGEADVSRILVRVNCLLIEDIRDDNFITLLLARIEPFGQSLVYASAGHATGYLLDAAGQVKASLRSTGVPLGIEADSAFPLGEVVPLAPGDIILFLTDGVAEARDPEGSAFGDRRALDVVRVYRDRPAQEIVYNLYHAVRAFSRNEPQVDDITATVIKVANGPPCLGRGPSGDLGSGEEWLTVRPNTIPGGSDAKYRLVDADRSCGRSAGADVDPRRGADGLDRGGGTGTRGVRRRRHSRVGSLRQRADRHLVPRRRPDLARGRGGDRPGRLRHLRAGQAARVRGRPGSTFSSRRGRGAVRRV